MRVVVDRVKCAGLGICAAQSPRTFEIAEDGEMVIREQDIGADRLEEIEDTVASCPTGALSLVDG